MRPSRPARGGIGIGLVIGFLLVFIMLAGEKGIWGTLEPILKKGLRRVRPASGIGDTGAKKG